MVIPPPTEDLTKRAEAGDARAQYALAAKLSRDGRAAEADHWLKSAAKSGEPDALYTLATRELQSKGGVPEAVRLLEAAAGSAAAARLLAVLYAEGLGVERDFLRARGIVFEAARRGDPAAMREIAGLLFLRDVLDADAAALIAAAAQRDPVAGAVYVRRAVENRPTDEGFVRLILQRLKSMKYPRTDELARGLERRNPDSSRTSATAQEDFQTERFWGRIEEKVDKPLDGRPNLETLSASPYVQVARAAVPSEMLDYVIAIAAQRLQPSMTFDPTTGAARVDPHRKSATATLGPVDQDLAIVELNLRLAQIAGVDSLQGEFLSVLRYVPGDEYKPHFDWIPPTSDDFGRGGQRVRTALLYLNDDYEGGETQFLSGGLTFKGAPGDVLVFSNVLPDGAADQSSRHAGLPVKSGVKWLGSKWFRERAYDF